MTEAVIRKSMDWFLYDNGLRHERVKHSFVKMLQLKTWLEFQSLVNP